jgi:hypothetical protein
MFTAPTSLHPVASSEEGPSPDIVCQGFLLATIATRLRVEWHAGLIDADAAMKELDSAVTEICAYRLENRNRS